MVKQYAPNLSIWGHKKEKMLVTSIFSFFQNIFKSLLLQGRDCVVKSHTNLIQATVLNSPKQLFTITSGITVVLFEAGATSAMTSIPPCPCAESSLTLTTCSTAREEFNDEFFTKSMYESHWLVALGF